MQELKIFPLYFKAVISGRKTFEVRCILDRTFLERERLLLKEFDGDNQEYTGRQLLIEITYISNYMQRPEYIIFSFKPIISEHNNLAENKGKE